MRWQDCFELIPGEGRGGWSSVGGDPDMGKQWPELFNIRNKTTGEVSRLGSMPKYTAEHYADKLFKELMHGVEMSLLT